MAVILREGGARPPLFVFAGAGGVARELAPLAAVLPEGRAVIALTPRDVDAVQPAGVEAMGAYAAGEVRAHQPIGPYHLLGYSFGGLLALEVARQLRAAGETVAFVGMIDTIFDRRWWPLRRFLGAQVRRTAGHLARLSRRPLRDAAPEFVERAAALFRRFADRRRGPPTPPTAPAAASMADLCLAAAARQAPRPYAGPVMFFGSRTDQEFGLDPATLWAPWLAALTVRRFEASHMDLVRAPVALAELAATLDAALDAATAPRA